MRYNVIAITALLGFIFVAPTTTDAQQSTNRVEGLRINDPRWHGITNAKIVVSPTRTIARGTLVMRDGRITAVGESASTSSAKRRTRMES